MSQRAKRPNRSEDGSVPVKRRKRTTAEEEEAASLAAAAWQPRSNDLKTIYNRTTTEAPAELFRKDLISAMKLPDSEPLASNEYWVIVDQWKQEWERGVQVPVNPDSLPEPSVTVTHCSSIKPQHEFKLPKNKYIRITNDDNFKVEDHALSSAPTQAEAACSYDLDECDVAWLKILNSERAMQGLGSVSEDKLERVIEQFEVSCWDKIQTILRNEEGLGIEYDENVICDVCRSPDSEEGNEMVFCDSCNICVHQACYGITKIPEGQWLCCTCNLGKRPECVLCPNKGGAMKCTRSGQKWAHVSCALWIPEVSIGCVEKMEPITKISSIPQSRWALICVLCRERVGACIQCSVKTCKTAYHVTCAFKHGLEMRAIIEDENADDGVKLRSYCEKHSKSSKKEKSVCSGSEDDDSKRKKRKDMTSEEKNQARAARLQEIEAEFYNHVSVKDVNLHLGVDADALNCIYNYWKLKRKAGNNKPLLPPKSEDVDMLSHKREQADLEKMRMFVQLRQDLERVRNLCYMVSRREKLSRSFFRMREQTFHKQIGVLETSPNLPNVVVQSVIEANHGPSIYDRLYSQEGAEDHTLDFDRILATIAGSSDSGEEKKDMNGLLKDLKNNPYKKVYFNGASKRRSGSVYGSSRSSASSEDERPTLKNDKENRLRSSSDDDKPQVNKKKPGSPRKSSKVAERRQKRFSTSSRCKVESSSEEDVKLPKESRSRLGQVERELGVSSDNSDGLMTPTRTAAKISTNKFMSSIYSDTDDTSDASIRNDAASDSQLNRLRTKASVKEFSHKPSTSKSPNKSSPENKKKSKTDVLVKRQKKDYVPSDLIVPQRQAAKKATENLKSTTTNRTAAKDLPITDESPPKTEERVSGGGSKPHKVRPKSSKDLPPIKKETSSEGVFDLEKEMDNGQEILAYVPQRQAAKKAAEHIKSGLGKPAAPSDPTVEASPVKKEAVVAKTAARIVGDAKRTKSSSNSSSSSSTSSSSDSSSSSSSDSDEATSAPPPPPPSSLPPSTRSDGPSASCVRDVSKRANVAKDRPFLDKGAKSAASSSSTDSSDSSSGPSATASTAIAASTVHRKKTESKIVTSTAKSTARRGSLAQREEPLRGKGRPSANNNRGGQKCPKSAGSERVGDVNVRSRDLFNSERSNSERSTAKPSVPSSSSATTTTARKGKVDELVERFDKETKSDKLQSPVGKADKKLNDVDIPNLEKEILERRGRQGPSKTKSTLDRLFGPDKKIKSDKQLKSTVKENKEPILPDKVSSVKKSPVKTKTLDEVFTEKSISDDNKIEARHKLTPKREDHVDSYVLENSAKSIDGEVRIAPEKADTQMGRSIFSPSHVKDAFDFDNFEDGFGIGKDEEIMKGPLTFNFGNTNLFKEDSKEDSARETLNLVEKLRMGLSKKTTSCDVDDGASVSSSIKNENDRNEFSEQVVPNSLSEISLPKMEQLKPPTVAPPATVNLEMRADVTAPTLPKSFDDDRNQDYRYSDLDADVPLEAIKNVPVQHHVRNDHSALGDERWVPPSEVFAMDPLNYERPPHFMPQYPAQAHHKTLPPHQIDLRQHHEELIAAKSPPRRIPQTPQLDAASLDCMPSPSPYTDVHPQAKWADSEVIPNRRSSSSSAASTSSLCSRRNDDDDVVKMRSDVVMVNHQSLENMGYLPYPTNPLDAFAAFPDSQFVGPVSLFPPPALNAQLPFPTTGPNMFPPAFGAPFPAPPHTVMPLLPKPVDETMPYSTSTCTAAFTTSQHNMALTAAMVNLPPTPMVKESESPLIVDETPPPSTPQAAVTTPEQAATSPAVSISTPNGSNILSSPSPSVKSNSSAGKKSPSKPTRASARVTSQLKSPNNKSPGKSPRQDGKTGTTAKGKTDSRRNSVKSNSARNQSRGGAGRGRGRGRGRNAHAQHNDFNDYIGANTIQHKLVGTVYDLDFDDDMPGESLSNLKAMRERRKSVDVHERITKSEYGAIKDASAAVESPKFSSPAHKNRSYSDLKELKPPTPVQEATPPPKSEVVRNNMDRTQIFPDMVQPVLPGPVDMRTYSNSFSHQQSYNETNLLTAFATGGTAEPHVHDDIDEDFEKEFQSALSAKKPVAEVPPLLPEIGSIKASLSDSRNQLKVKIKGPIANYSASLPIIPPPSTVDVSAVANITMTNNLNNSVTGASSGTSNLRRMRKKELLRQYWTQDMNMDDSTCTPGFNAPPTVAPVNRTIITIPKAVASMTSIPTKDDYRDYRTIADDLDTTKHRKDTKSRTGALTRELKQLDLVNDEDRRNFGNNACNYDTNAANKRRGRPPRLQTATPKIKIKFGTAAIDDKKDRVKPPKKRLTTIIKPSVEDLKRESMKFRKMVMADFSEEKKKKRDKGEKRKRKKSKPEVQIISNERTLNSTKLIIRLSKKVEGGDGETKQRTSSDVTSVVDVLDDDAGGEAAKMTPIKLKLSRCQVGSGYVMKTSEQPPSTETKAEEASQPGQPPPVKSPPDRTLLVAGLTDGVAPTTTLPLNKDCQVR